MFDDEIDDYHQKRKIRRISRRDLAVEECNTVTGVSIGVETVQNFKKMETFVVDRNAKETEKSL